MAYYLCNHKFLARIMVPDIVEQVINLIIKCLVISLTFVSPFQQWACLAMQVIAVAYRVQSWIRLMCPFFPWVAYIAPSNTMKALQQG